MLLDSHVLHWWSAEPERLSGPASSAIEGADDLAVSAISWFELAWLAAHGRIALGLSLRAWLSGLAETVRTVGLTQDIAASAVELPASFPGDPADRIIFATAAYHGWQLVTKDERIRSHPWPRQLAVW